MFAKIFRQNREIKEKFYNLISEKENNQKKNFS
ncbi:nuclease-related domain family protein [Thermosipho africanus Ob7]|nr:nuclease-related domain family protein [Thermosipho africanus Ob7]